MIELDKERRQVINNYDDPQTGPGRGGGSCDDTVILARPKSMTYDDDDDDGDDRELKTGKQHFATTNKTKNGKEK